MCVCVCIVCIFVYARNSEGEIVAGSQREGEEQNDFLHIKRGDEEKPSSLNN